ncbi:hypothetical protein LLG95_13600 [bacterium]|nr:hypothetical protein [bacterium]
MAPHWTALPDAWCLNFANNGRIDGGHPNALGAQAIAERLYAAIRPAILIRSNTSIAVFGDSILATAYLPANQRIDALLKTFSQRELTALRPHAWQFYE